MTDTAVRSPAAAEGTVFAVILAVSFCHFINDVVQSLLSALYPMLKTDFRLEYWQIGFLTMAFMVTASLLQPAIGLYTDKRPMPYSLPVGMGSSMVGLILLATAHSYAMLLIGAVCIGLGSAIFHPESSRVARLASGGRYGFAQSTFQVGGNLGQAMGPLLAAFIVVPYGQGSVAWFALAAMIGIVVLRQVGVWYSAHLKTAHLRKPAVSRFPGSAAWQGGDRAGDPGAADLHQERLHRRAFQLLHLLRDREVRRLGAGIPGHAVPFPRRVGARHPARWPVWRPLRTQDSDLVFDPRRVALHIGAALCWLRLRPTCSWC